MLVKEDDGVWGIDDLREHVRYQICCKVESPRLPFKARLKGIAIGRGKQLFAHFEGEESIDVREILFPVYPA